ncbi:divalent-cation tolerance protein CutA [Dactylosporangium vinaceum]|uniref:Divalent-cation tolerance protein CutA n=1 Tax=Dactylosporangium vinaceum TaxID=53362 RepID=A0ABV5MIM5_9ACTN|nr:divalent-cation tolerance protein CutA [Dactylosporangium vinaceum]UAB95156.1 divalent-cation tolerance protein CutA [Dactylosporangium vinaceum]
MHPEVSEVVITAPDAEWLADFTRQLVEDRLCSSGHCVESIRSIYKWRGDIYDKTEARVMLHTRTSLVPHIIDRTNREHPYEVPCVVATPIVSGNPAYLQWILDETKEVGS